MSKKDSVLVIELTDRRDSGYVKEGTQGTIFEQRLNSPSARRIKTTSVVKQSDGSYRQIRHIAGCPTIFVDEQDAKGYKPNGIEDNIWIENGSKTIVNLGRTMSMYRYLKACEFNGTNDQRPEGAEVMFKELNIQEEAKKELASQDVSMRAFDMTVGLATATKDGKWIFEEERIDYMCNLFLIAGLESYEEKVLGLRALAAARPKYFLDLIGDTRSNTRAHIGQAIQYKVLDISGPHASFVANGANIIKFNSKEKNERIDQLVDYLLGKKGEDSYQTLLAATEQAKVNQLETV